MKKNLLFLFVSLLFSIAAVAQHGFNSLGLGAVDYVEVPDDPDGSLDVPGGFTFEAWIFNFGGASNQKVAGKLAADFVNGFIFGIEDLQVNMEVFDENGTNTNLKTGNISQVGWTHVAGTYEVGGMLSVYINGVKAGETAASAASVDFNTNPFRIGIAPWDVNALGFGGYVDEVRYWQAVLDEANIRGWMHKEVTTDHPNYDNLTLYHKYNETMGPDVMDSSPAGNNGTFSATAGQVLEPFFLPFKGDLEFFENDVQGVWNAKRTGSSDILSVEAVFFDTLDYETSAVFAHSDGDYGISGSAPAGFSGSLSKVWTVTTQGLPLVNLTFDLSPIDVPAGADVVLLASEEPDFSDADVIDGVLDGNTFSTVEEDFEDGYFYTLGFTVGTNTNDLLGQEHELEISPNPSNGDFTLIFEHSAAERLNLVVYDFQGKIHWTGQMPEGQLRYQLRLADVLNPGSYFVKMTNDSGQYALRKLLID